MTADHQTPERPYTRHPLYLGWGGVALRLGDQGITPEQDGLRFTRDGRVTFRPYSDIVEINLSMNAMPRSPATAQTTIRFSNGMRFTVMNTDAWGRPTPEQNQSYYRFKADLHERLIASGAATEIRFTTGATPGRAQFMRVVMIIAAAFFIGGPIIIFLMTWKAQALLVCLAGLGLVLPLFRTMDRNTPSTYNPKNPPDMLT